MYAMKRRIIVNVRCEENKKHLIHGWKIGNKIATIHEKGMENERRNRKKQKMKETSLTSNEDKFFFKRQKNVMQFLLIALLFKTLLVYNKL